MVTLFAWMAHRLVSSKRCTMKSSVACVAASYKHWPLTMRKKVQNDQMPSTHVANCNSLRHVASCCMSA